jgi:hypothetical protein
MFEITDPWPDDLDRFVTLVLLIGFFLWGLQDPDFMPCLYLVMYVGAALAAVVFGIGIIVWGIWKGRGVNMNEYDGMG